MAKFPYPPGVDELKAIPPVMTTLDAGTTIFRVFRSQGAHPVRWNTFRYFGPTSARFDHQLRAADGKPQIAGRGIMYGALGGRKDGIPTCLAEVYQGARTINRYDGAPVLCSFALHEPLRLLDLTGAFATQIGASMAINSGPRPRAQRWAQQLYEAYPNAHGILYSSSMHANKTAVALFERSASAIPSHTVFYRQLADPLMEHVLRRTAHYIGYTVVDIGV